MLCDKAYRLRFPDSVVSSGFMELLLNSTESSNLIEALKTGINDSGVNITQSGFLNLAFSIPPIGEQFEIQRMVAESLSVIDNVELDIETNLQKAEALRQSILKKAFAGELVPQDLNDEPAAALLARIRVERATLAAARKQKKPRPAKV
jgi:type I restriction enzyme S subunit